ncbi:MAG: OmpA family protein [Bacteroidota bacterium]
MMKQAWLILLLIVLSGMVRAQHYNSDSKKAVKQFEEAIECYRARDASGAEEALLKAIKADGEFIDAYQLLSQICYDTGRLEEAIEYYATSLEIDPEGNPDGYRLLAGLVIQTGDYRRSLELVERFLSYSPEEVNHWEAGIKLKENCLFAIRAMEQPVPFQPENLGDSVNSELNEYWPSLSVDEQLLMFTVMLPEYPAEGEAPSHIHEDFFFSKREGDGWSSRKGAGAPLNTMDNEGAQTMTADGRMLYFTACNRRDGKGQCDIYRSTWNRGKWSRPVNLGSPVNTRYSDKHPTISADGRVLIFTSNRPGGKGSYDIWMSQREGDGWSLPVNLGDSVNTAQLEQSPFLHPDQQSLYFSSTGWPGMGQGDLFFSSLNSNNGWSAPVNLGYPINTYNDEIGLTVNAKGDRAYFASDREKGTDTDIYTFELPHEVRPILVSYLSGRVYDSKSMKGLGALVRLIDLETEEVVMEAPSQPGEGDYLVPLPTNRDYALNVTADGYLFYSEHFAFRGEHSRTRPFMRDIPMERIGVGSRVVLNNIFFETDSYRLLAASAAELNRVVVFMEENPSVVVEIGGHTDHTGSDRHNQALSQQRAKAVLDYLAAKGVAAQRLVATGYGDREPVSEGETEKGRALNRRTEFKIIEIVKGP